MAKILVYENNDLNQKLFTDLLVMKGHEVLHKKTTDSVIEEVGVIKPNLILMDIDLDGGVSGLDLTEELKSDVSTSHIPIVIITAYAMQNDKDKIENSYCDMYLLKPVSIDNFFAVVAKYLDI